MNLRKLTLFSCMAVAVMVALVLRTSAVQARTLQNCGGWSVVSSPDPNQFANSLTAVATVSTNDVWAVGYFQGSSDNTLAEHWDGTKWSIIASPSPSKSGDNLFGVAAVASNDVWAVGDYNGAKGYYDTLIEHWDGSAWSVVPSPNPGTGPNSLNAVTAISTNDVWAVGFSSNRNGGNFTLIEHWNGTQWSAVSSPSPGTYSNNLTAVAAVATSDVWAIGSFNSDNGKYDQTLAEHWDGKSWSVVVSPNVASRSNRLLSVTAVPGTNQLWAVGFFAIASYHSAKTLIEHWTGTKWVRIPNPIAGSTQNSLSGVTGLSMNNVWAVGGGGPNGSPILLEHWDGTQWSVVPGPSTPAFSHLFAIAGVTGTTQVWTVGESVDSTDIDSLTAFYC